MASETSEVLHLLLRGPASLAPERVAVSEGIAVVPHDLQSAQSEKDDQWSYIAVSTALTSAAKIVTSAPLEVWRASSAAAGCAPR